MQVKKRIVDDAMSGWHTVFIYFVSAHTHMVVAYNTQGASVY